MTPNTRGWQPQARPPQPERPEETTAVDLPRVPGHPMPNARQAAADLVRDEVMALLPRPPRPQPDLRAAHAEAVDRPPARSDSLPGGRESGYCGRPTYVMGEKVWCWFGELTGKWWAFVPRESRLTAHGDTLVEARTPQALRAEIGRVLQETRP